MGELYHSAHDAGKLLASWKALADRFRLGVSVVSEEGEFPIIALENAAAMERTSGGYYLSAGVHGDECAPVWALLEWAESGFEKFSATPMVIFPCINPVGLAENTRVNGEGVDLNRRFQDDRVPLIGAWQKFLAGRQFDVAVNLHEDYEAGGIYLYELARSESPGDRLLTACQDLIPRETADDVDGSEFDNGLLRRETTEEEMRRVVDEELDGWPEAIYLYLNHAKDSFTFETPSEMELSRRIATHRRFLETVVQ